MEIRTALFVIKTVTWWQNQFEDGMVRPEIVEEAADMLQEATETIVDAYQEGQELLETQEIIAFNNRTTPGVCPKQVLVSEDEIKSYAADVDRLTNKCHALQMDRDHAMKENVALEKIVHELKIDNGVLNADIPYLRDRNEELRTIVASVEAEKIREQKRKKACETIGAVDHA